MAPARPAHRKKRSPAKWRTRGSKAGPSVVIVGFGRMGGALALGLKRAKWKVSVLPRSGDSIRRAVGYGLPLADHDALTGARLVILAVQDAAVPQLAQQLLADIGPDTSIIHCAGALDLSVFGSSPEMLRHARGSFHPLVAVSDPEDELAGHAVAVSASTRGLLAELKELASALGLKAFEVPEARRAAYHAGAVMSAGGLVALASAAVEALKDAGVDEQVALEALLPLMHSAIRGMEARGLARGLTGPVPRGDLQVVQSHLAALPADLSTLYRALSLRALELIADRLPPETRNALEKALRSE